MFVRLGRHTGRHGSFRRSVGTTAAGYPGATSRGLCWKWRAVGFSRRPGGRWRSGPSALHGCDQRFVAEMEGGRPRPPAASLTMRWHSAHSHRVSC